MKQILLMIAVVALVGCGKKEPVQPSATNPEATKPEKETGKEALNQPTPEPKAPKRHNNLGNLKRESRCVSSPAIGSDGTVYVGSKDKKLYAINGKSGVKLWEFETGDGVDSSPAIGSDGTVYVGSSDKKLYAINGKSGVKLWEFETGGCVSPPPPSDLMARFTSGQMTTSSMPSMARVGSSYGNLKRECCGLLPRHRF